MSWSRMDAVTELRNISTSEKAILWVLASHENDLDGRCFPSLSRIAKESCLARKTVTKLLGELRDKRLIDWTQGTRSGKANEYTFGPLLEKVDKKDPRRYRNHTPRDDESNPYHDGRPYRADLIGFMP